MPLLPQAAGVGGSATLERTSAVLGLLQPYVYVFQNCGGGLYALAMGIIKKGSLYSLIIVGSRGWAFTVLRLYCSIMEHSRLLDYRVIMLVAM